MNDEFFISTSQANRCAIILAGGDGLRLQSFVHKLRGDCLPKQYVKLLGDQSMLEATLRRAHQLIPSERQIVVVTKSHFNYAEVAQQLANYPKVSVAVQPINLDTGVGLLLALAQLCQLQGDATVTIFPSDHFIEEEDLFLAHVDTACRLVEQDHSKIVLLGIAPNGPETEYGYILPDHRRQNAFSFGARGVTRFIEKPQSILARKLILQGSLWNTMVTVFNLRTLLAHVRAICPGSFGSFEQIFRAASAKNRAEVVKQVYAQSEPLNFSRGILQEVAAEHKHALLVLPVRGVHWSDWGSEKRIMKTLAHSQRRGGGIEFAGGLLNSLRTPNMLGSA